MYPGALHLLYVNNLFGDPSMSVWREYPSLLKSKNENTHLSTQKDENGIPKHFNLYQNYPNPFNPSTNINFDIPEATNVSIKLYDLLGKEIAILKNEFMNAGFYSIKFTAKNIPSGLYIYRIVTDKNIETKKMSVIK